MSRQMVFLTQPLLHLRSQKSKWEQGIQVKATNSNFTNEPHNDDFRFRDDVYWLEYVQYPIWSNNSWPLTNKQYGPDKYCNEDAWRDHVMHMKCTKDHSTRNSQQQHQSISSHKRSLTNSSQKAQAHQDV
jgi:hypothetical protein